MLVPRHCSGYQPVLPIVSMHAAAAPHILCIVEYLFYKKWNLRRDLAPFHLVLSPDHQDCPLSAHFWTKNSLKPLVLYHIPSNSLSKVLQASSQPYCLRRVNLRSQPITSTIDSTLSQPLHYHPLHSANKEKLQSLIKILDLQAHPEGGFFRETDRDPLHVPSPFSNADKDTTRNAATAIYYLITPDSPMGNFHFNKARTMHTLHYGRGRYVVIHADEGNDGTKSRVETFVVGPDIWKGEKLQWMVEGGKYKASFLLPDEEGGKMSEGLLISEVSHPSCFFL